MALDKQKVIEAIRPVQDPEVGFSIVDMGLIYDVEVPPDSGSVKVAMTLTSPMCPLGPQIIAATKAAVESLDEVESATVDLVWDPPWDPAEMASDEVKDRLGIW
ncbi:MAG: metal-sulfur cluster assembly factor [Acidobacteriota bacterium]|nr:metal-sulfur cluster assembly factor [Acidobacteriota bacterium]